MTIEDDDVIEDEAPDDIMGDIRAAMDQVAATEPAAETAPERARGPDGKFISAADDPAKAAIDPVATPVKPAAENTTAMVDPANPAAPQSVAAPEHWSAADKERFAKIPPDAQAFLLDRHKSMEGDYTRRVMQVQELKRDFEPVQQLMAPHMEAIRRMGGPLKLIEGWAGAEQRLASGDGVGVIAETVRNYRLDPMAVARALGIQVGEQDPSAAQPQYQHPQQIQLPPHIEAELAEGRQFREQLKAEKQQAVIQGINGKLETFRSAKDQGGNLLHPHYEALEHVMAALYTAAQSRGEDPSLDHLYEQASWSAPDVREKLKADWQAAQQAQLAEAESKRLAEARTKAVKAQRAGASVASTTNAGQTVTPRQIPASSGPDDIMADLRAAMDLHANA